MLQVLGSREFCLFFLTGFRVLDETQPLSDFISLPANGDNNGTEHVRITQAKAWKELCTVLST